LRPSTAATAVEQTNHTHHKNPAVAHRCDCVAWARNFIADERQKDNGSHQPLNKVIHDAFKTMERELRRVVDKQRRDKKHTPIPVRRISRSARQGSALPPLHQITGALKKIEAPRRLDLPLHMQATCPHTNTK
jgi:hypothetical protein